MVLAEKMIRLDIIELSMDRIGPRKEQIKRDIRSMYCGGVIDEDNYLILNNLLLERFRKVTDEYFKNLKLPGDEIIENEVRL